MQNVLFQMHELSRAEYLIGTLLRFLLIAFFVIMSTKNLLGDQQMAQDFARWGFPNWLRIFTAIGQISAALLLLHPRTSFYGGVVLTCILTGALFIHLTYDRPAALISD